MFLIYILQEASLIGIDSLGFDLRVCSGTQVQTLRFGFKSRVYPIGFHQMNLLVKISEMLLTIVILCLQASSEYSAERQLNELLFPRSNQKVQKVKQARRKES